MDVSECLCASEKQSVGQQGYEQNILLLPYEYKERSKQIKGYSRETGDESEREEKVKGV